MKKIVYILVFAFLILGCTTVLPIEMNAFTPCIPSPGLPCGDYEMTHEDYLESMENPEEKEFNYLPFLIISIILAFWIIKILIVRQKNMEQKPKLMLE